MELRPTGYLWPRNAHLPSNKAPYIAFRLDLLFCVLLIPHPHQDSTFKSTLICGKPFPIQAMSAPSIPNLLSLRGRGGRGRGRGRGRGGSEPGSRAAASHDSIIQGTDNDAAVSRLSAVDLGYLSDPYARYFVSALDGPPPRRFPIINRGPCLTQRRLPYASYHVLLLISRGDRWLSYRRSFFSS